MLQHCAIEISWHVERCIPDTLHMTCAAAAVVHVCFGIWHEVDSPCTLYLSTGNTALWLRYAEWLLTCPVSAHHMEARGEHSITWNRRGSCILPPAFITSGMGKCLNSFLQKQATRAASSHPLWSSVLDPLLKALRPSMRPALGCSSALPVQVPATQLNPALPCSHAHAVSPGPCLLFPASRHSP